MSLANITLNFASPTSLTEQKKVALFSSEDDIIKAKVHYFKDCELICEAEFTDNLLDLLLYSPVARDVERHLYPLYLEKDQILAGSGRFYDAKSLLTVIIEYAASQGLGKTIKNADSSPYVHLIAHNTNGTLQLLLRQSERWLTPTEVLFYAASRLERVG